MGVLIFGVVFILLLIGYAITSIASAMDKWYAQGWNDAANAYHLTGVRPNMPDLTGKDYKKEYIECYTQGFQEALIEIDKKINEKRD